ncbi:Gfo/Idh/MocA family oxidoreductase [bacterium]|nr:Gfo/Idh/MocA family oxidoreductase [bacterium]
MSASPVTVVLAGIGGYGYYYLQELWNSYSPDEVRLAGVVDPDPGRSGHLPRLQALKVPVFPDMDSFYHAGHRADLAIVVSPIQFHAVQSITALRGGSRVLCDKPLCAAVAEADSMIAAERETGLPIMVGYQWSWSDAIQRLKRDLIDGAWGRPLRAGTICLWPRGYDYYARNSWAGAIRTAGGRPVNDSPANNAAAHFLHNLLFLLGEEMHTGAEPLGLEAFLRRAYPIENFDTIACRIETRRCPDIYFFASHVTAETLDPMFEIVCEQGRIVFGGERREIMAETPAGDTRVYGSPDADQFKKLHDAVASVRTGARPLCGAAAARAQTVCIAMLQELAIDSFPPESIRKDPGGQRLYVEGLGKTLEDCYHTHSMPAAAPHSRRKR